MTEVTLRRAAQISNALRHRIEAATPVQQEEDAYTQLRRRGRRGSNAPRRPLAAVTQIDIDTASAAKIADLRDDLLAERATLFELMEIYTHIRTAVSAANEAAGISEHVTQRVMLLRKQKILSDMLADIVGGTFDKAEFKDKLAAMRDRLSKGGTTEVSIYGGESGQRKDVMTVPLLTEEDRADTKDALAEVTRELASLDDQLVALNANNKIRIADKYLDLLRKEGII